MNQLFYNYRSAQLRLKTVILLVAILMTCSVGSRADYATAIDPDAVLVNSFTGWGTSLCWWPNVVGGYTNRLAYADLIFRGLQLNIVRYNIGGGENPALTNSMDYRARMPGFEPQPGVWDWKADANQRWFLQTALAQGVQHVIAFANSPPYWMTVSGSVTGSHSVWDNNLRPTNETDFANYLATVLNYLSVHDHVDFEGVTPMNEPGGAWWTYGRSSEGTFISRDQQARVVNQLRSALVRLGLKTAILAPEENDEQSAIASIQAYDSTARSNVDGLVTHTYGANNAGGLRWLADSLNKPLWVSEYGDNDGSGLQMARRIRDDITDLHARAWTYWQVVDSAGGWGMIANPLGAQHDEAFTIHEKYYVMAQFSRFIRPGFKILSTGDGNSLAGYDETNHVLVIVTVNDSQNGFHVDYDLNAFEQVGTNAMICRTSSGESLSMKGETPVKNRRLTLVIPSWSVTTEVISNLVRGMPPVSVNDNDLGDAPGHFSYSGHWGYYAAQSGAYQNDNHWSGDPGDFYQVRFEGSAVRVYAAKDRICGIAAMSIDGGPETYIDYYSPAREDDAIIWMSPLLPPGSHTLRVRVTGKKNPASAGIIITADRLGILSPSK